MAKHDYSKELALKNAEFSLRMEGLVVDDEYKVLCEKLLTREISFAEYLKTVKTKQGLRV